MKYRALYGLGLSHQCRDVGLLSSDDEYAAAAIYTYVR